MRVLPDLAAGIRIRGVDEYGARLQNALAEAAQLPPDQQAELVRAMVTGRKRPL